MSTSYHIRQLSVREFFSQKGLIFMENGKTGFFCFLKKEKRKHVENKFIILSLGSVAHSFKLF